MCCGKESRRIILWMCWVVNMLITSVYYILSFVTSRNLISSYKALDIQISNEIWRAPVAAAVLGGLLVLLFNILSCIILIRKSIAKRGPGFGYGFIVAMCFTLAFFTLLCGLVLEGFKDVVESQLEKVPTWSKYNTGAYIGTVALAYLCFVMFMLFCFALVVFQGAVNEELGIGGANPYAKMQDVMYAGNPAMYGMQMQQAPMMGMHDKMPSGMTIPAGSVPMPPADTV